MTDFTAFFRDGTNFSTMSTSTMLTLSNGNIVVAWRATENTEAGSNTGVFARVYTPEGVAVSDLFRVETSSAGTQEKITLTGTADGGFIAAWTSADASGSDTDGTAIRARAFTANGTPKSDDFVVNSVTTGSQTDANLLTLDDGRILVTWSSDDGQGADTDTFAVRGRFLNSDGTLGADTETVLNTSYALTQWIPRSTVLSDGSYIVMWSSFSATANMNTLVGTKFASDGTPIGATDVLMTSSGVQVRSPNVVALENGGYAITYEDQQHIFARIFDADNNPVGNDFIVGDAKSGGTLSSSTVTVLDDGRIFFVWQTTDGVAEIRGRLYEADGTAVDDYITLSRAGVTGLLALPMVVALPDGKVAVTYLQATPREIVVNVFDPTNPHAPTDIAISANEVSEGASLGTIVGALSATDADGDALTWTLSDDADGKFALVIGPDGKVNVVVKDSLDYETATSHTITVTASDGVNETSHTLTINVGDVEQGIGLSNTNILESQRAGATIGALSMADSQGATFSWSVVADQGDGSLFDIKVNEDGTVNLIQKVVLNHEDGDGIFDVTVKATDVNGAETTHVFSVTVGDDPFKLSSAPTGKSYLSVVESAESGQELGYITVFDFYDTSAKPASATLVDDAGGLFSMTTRTVDGELRYYLTLNGQLDHETADQHSVTIRSVDTNGISSDKTFEVHVLDVAEAGATARGTITIDANTALADTHGGVNWDTYLDSYFAQITPGLPAFLPSGSGWSADTPSSEYVYNNTKDGSMISITGSDLLYNWTDPISGEDAHVVSGMITGMSFGEGVASGNTWAVTNPEIKISGLDLSNNSALMNRIYGEAQIVAQTWMYGADGGTPADIEFTKAIFASYAQNFKGSAGSDTYTGTLFADTIAGNDGADMLAGGGGDDKINGGEGTDTAIYTGARADYSYVRNGAGGWTITDEREGAINDGIDKLSSVEKLQFSDTTVTLVDNTAPKSLTLSGTTIAENAAVNSVVGVLSATDAEGDALTWSLSGGDGMFKLLTKNREQSLVVKKGLDLKPPHCTRWS